MVAALTIGQFARMAQLSATTLRHYHAVGLLEPAAVDPATGYRRYTMDQVADAHVVRRLRQLDMSIDDVRAVMAAADHAARDALIAEHLAVMEQRLRATADAVASLRELLVAPLDVLDVRPRAIAATPAWTIGAEVALADVARWATPALRRLVVAIGREHRTGPPGVLYEPALFDAGCGRAVAFVPTSRTERPAPPITAAVLPAVDVVVGVHRGRLADLDRSYAAVGRVVAEHRTGTVGPIREHFLGRDGAVHVVEIAWPVDLTG